MDLRIKGWGFMTLNRGDIAIIKRIDVIVIVLKQRRTHRTAEGSRSLQMCYVLGSSGLYWIASSALHMVKLSSEYDTIDI